MVINYICGNINEGPKIMNFINDLLNGFNTIYDNISKDINDKLSDFSKRRELT